MAKTRKRSGGKRGKKTVRGRDLVAKRGGSAKGGTKYTMFSADGTPVRATPPTGAQAKEPTSIEFPN
jgi:hypothetical protein